MWKNYLKLAYRNLFKSKLFSFINIFGLTLGLTACLIIFQYVRYELSYDRFHKNSDRIYRVQHDRYLEGELQYQKAQSFIPTGEAMLQEYPEVEDYTTLFRISAESDIIVRHVTESGDVITFSENEVFHAKGNFLEIFSLKITEGQRDIKSIPDKTVLISKSTANKYFGESSPIGKTISHNYAENYEVIGVFEDLPKNSHIDIDFLFAWQEVTPQDSGGDMLNWRWDGFYTYILLLPETNAASLEEKFPDLINKYKSEQVNEKVGSVFTLQPLNDIHLYSNLLGELNSNGDGNLIYTLFALGIFVLLIAWINFLNLSTSQSFGRLKEVGVRKVIGSGKTQIFYQFLTESFLLNLIAILASGLLVYFLDPILNPILGIDIYQALIVRMDFWLVILLLFLIGGIAAGVYPAWVMSSFKLTSALKGKLTKHTNSTLFNFKYSLVIFQFVISISLIGASTMAYKQIGFMKHQSLGINIDNTLVINNQVTFGPPGSDSIFLDNLKVFRNTLKDYSDVKAVTASYEIPGKEHQSMMPNFRHSKNPDEFVTLYFTRMDHDFIPTFDANLIAGRNFIEGLDKQTTIILNMEAIQTLGYESADEAIGQEVVWGNQNTAKAEIIGVVDFRATSYKNENYPIAYTSTFFPFRYTSIKFNNLADKESREQIAMVKNVWKSVFPDKPFDYFFLDEQFESHYQSDNQFGFILGAFTFLAIVVACLGLFAMATLTVGNRTKEIGLRKIMGASIGNLMFLLSRNFILLILIAGLISVPIIKLSLEHWLENYPYRADLTWWIYLMPIGLILAISAVTIGSHIWKASIVNPAKLVKYE